MKLTPPLTVEEVATFLDCEFVGNGNQTVSGLNEIHVVEAGDIVFVDNPKYYDKALTSNATIILIDKKVNCPEGKALLVSQNPFADFNKLIKHNKPLENWQGTPEVGENSMVHASVSFGKNVRVGKNCNIYPGVVIGNDVEIGNNVSIHANAVIGSDAFYYKNNEGVQEKLYSCGDVIIEDNVEIGALTSIDRGVTGSTIIGIGTKIDNQVQIGHDTRCGKNCLFAAHVGIAGCVIIGDNVTLWGQVGVISSVTIGDNAVVLGQSGVGNSLPGNKTYLGSPAIEARQMWKQMVAVKNLGN